MRHRISFAGAGKVAGALCMEFFRAGMLVDLIVSPREVNGRALASSCHAGWSPEPVFPDETGIIIVSVPDHALTEVLGSIRCNKDTAVVHTAGSMGLDAFPSGIERKGVFYPLQTFSNRRKIDFTGLPFLLESSDRTTRKIMEDLAGAVKGRFLYADSQKRLMMHLAAVFICNFTNHMLVLGNEIAKSNDIPFNLFLPLLKETVSKASDMGPGNAQTGPAVRNDTNIIEKHLKLLSSSPDMQNLYRDITMSIMKYHNKQ